MLCLSFAIEFAPSPFVPHLRLRWVSSTHNWVMGVHRHAWSFAATSDWTEAFSQLSITHWVELLRNTLALPVVDCSTAPFGWLVGWSAGAEL
jgi:hypothetical protein